RLAECCRLTYDEYLERFDRMNLCDARAEYLPNGNGYAFDLPMARARADCLIAHRFEPGLTVVVMGKRAAKAFGLHGDYFLRYRLNGAAVYVVPHPSGANR